jgi:hypothetical protein
LDLLIAGTVLLLLLVATYSQRSTWIMLGSTALTVALVTGFGFLTSADQSNPLSDGVERLAAALPSGWDRWAHDLANAIEQASAASEAARKRAAAHAGEPVLAMSMPSASEWFGWTAEPPSDAKAEPEPNLIAEPAAETEITDEAELVVEPEVAINQPVTVDEPETAEPVTAPTEPESSSVSIASITKWFGWASEPAAETAEPVAEPSEPSVETSVSAEEETEPEEVKAKPEIISGPPIQWRLDAPADGGAFAVRGANISDQPLNGFEAVLKPDSGAEQMALVLDVDGTGGAIVPPGAQFILKTEGLTASQAEQLGGAILSVAYLQAGRRKSSIMYLTPAMLAARTPSN